MTFAQQVLQFNLNLPTYLNVPNGIEVLFPYGDSRTIQAMTTFYEKYYNDQEQRIFIFGINPGRFGAGVTGVPFTDPIRLAEECSISNNFQKKPELSSVFVYEFIHAFGGLEVFYKQFYISSLSPLGFTKNSKNYNYYDDRELQEAVTPFIVDSIQKQQEFPISRKVALCMGQGKNAAFFQKINEQYHFFDEILVLPHPRWVMQYRRKSIEEFVSLYVEHLIKAKTFT
ncbi:MAG: DUF4918 family protein [Saprospiraceae bacterium]|nr:DUF4918 family protein [Saprospiraceae bacterium]